MHHVLGLVDHTVAHEAPAEDVRRVAHESDRDLVDQVVVVLDDPGCEHRLRELVLESLEPLRVARELPPHLAQHAATDRGAPRAPSPRSRRGPIARTSRSSCSGMPGSTFHVGTTNPCVFDPQPLPVRCP